MLPRNFGYLAPFLTDHLISLGSSSIEIEHGHAVRNHVVFSSPCQKKGTKWYSVHLQPDLFEGPAICRWGGWAVKSIAEC